MILNCFRYLNVPSLYDVKVMSLYEYEARMYAYNLQQLDNEEDLHLQAWLIQSAQATKKKGKYGEESVYEDFKAFFDKHERLKDLEKLTEGEPELSPKLRSLADAARKANEGR